jgi:phosphoribosylanthranilate isomerase
MDSLNRIFTKICGIRDVQTAELATQHGADYLGFILYPPSPRYISVEQATDLFKEIPRKALKVAVMVNPDDKLLEQVSKNLNPEYFQLHGDESIERVDEIIRKFGFPIIKAVGIENSTDLLRAEEYQEVASALLLDKKSASYGGTGQILNWELVARGNFDIPVFLSGGLNAQNIEEAVKITGLKQVDVSSGVESKPGVKDPLKIVEFLNAVANI